MAKMNANQRTSLARTRLTEEAFCAWVGQAAPGDQLAYHRGYLAFDTGADSTFGTPAVRRELRCIANRAWQLAGDRAVHLVQLRHGVADYSYLVVARRRARVADGALEALLEQAGLSDPHRAA